MVTYHAKLIAHKPPYHSHDWYYKRLTRKGSSVGVLTHCRQQLMHAIWSLLQGKGFIPAYEQSNLAS